MGLLHTVDVVVIRQLSKYDQSIFAPPTARRTSQGVERFDQIGYTGTMRGPSRPKGHVMGGQGHRPASAPVANGPVQI